VSDDDLRAFIVREMASNGADWDAALDLVFRCDGIPDRAVRARTLGELLLMSNHRHHQGVTMAMQQLADPAGIAAIRARLDTGFDDLAYTCSDDIVIAKWFSHALWKIGTPEAIALIRRHASSANAQVAEEMTYRLERIAQDTPELLAQTGAAN